jgi:hypothetical protein
VIAVDGMGVSRGENLSIAWEVTDMDLTKQREKADDAREFEQQVLQMVLMD